MGPPVNLSHQQQEIHMGILLWLLGVPLSLIIILKLFGVF
jgi:hypothetical protein